MSSVSNKQMVEVEVVSYQPQNAARISNSRPPKSWIENDGTSTFGTAELLI